jgi:hypothetical protein
MGGSRTDHRHAGGITNGSQTSYGLSMLVLYGRRRIAASGSTWRSYAVSKPLLRVTQMHPKEAATSYLAVHQPMMNAMLHEAVGEGRSGTSTLAS